MARARKPAVRARHAAHEMLSERRAQAMAALEANEEDLAEYVRLAADIEETIAARDHAIGEAAAVRDRAVAKFLRDCPDAATAARTALVTLLDSAHEAFKAAAADAVATAAAAIARARRDQGAALGRVRSRGTFKAAELAVMVGLTTTEVAKLIKSSTPHEVTEMPAPGRAVPVVSAGRSAWVAGDSESVTEVPDVS